MKTLTARASVAIALTAALALPAQDPAPLRVCATTPNLGALVRAIGGSDLVDLQVFCRPSQDPHYLRALPSFVKHLHQADLLVVVGLELEGAWMPAMLDQARNPRVRPGSMGHLNASAAVEILGVPGGLVDRAAGDVHSQGNPHFMTDPVSGARVADAIAKRLGDLRPGQRETFDRNLKVLREKIGALVVGEQLAKAYDFTKLVRLYRAGRLEEFLRTTKQLDALGGALKDFAALRGSKVIADHDAWRYLTATLDLETLGFLEPKPGIPPSTAHLRELVTRARAEAPRALLHVPYFERQPIEFVAAATGVTPVELAHQVGALPGTDDYVTMLGENLERLRAALARKPGSDG